MELVILCEGVTEKAVIADFLKPYCTNFNKVSVLNAEGSGNLVIEFQKLAETALEANVEAYVLCLIDIYKAPFSYPKRILESENPPVAQFEYIKRFMEEKISKQYRERFLAFPVMLELETWILADVAGLNEYFRPSATQKVKIYHAPETISHPAKELAELWRRFKNDHYDKVRHGKRLFKHTSAERVYDDSCPHFELLINQLLKIQGMKPSKETYRFIQPNEALFREFQELEDQEQLLYQSINYETTEDEIKRIDIALEEIEAKKRTLNEKIMAAYQEQNNKTINQ